MAGMRAKELDGAEVEQQEPRLDHGERRGVERQVRDQQRRGTRRQRRAEPAEGRHCFDEPVECPGKMHRTCQQAEKERAAGRMSPVTNCHHERGKGDPSKGGVTELGKAQREQSAGEEGENEIQRLTGPDVRL